MKKSNQIIRNKIKTFKSKIIEVKNGDIYKVIDREHNLFRGFGELYFSSIKFNRIKGWKLHKKMNMLLVVPFGLVKFAFSINKNKPFKEILIGSNKKDYKIIYVPSNIWFAFKGYGKPHSIVCNLSDIIHSSSEVINCDLNEIPHDW